MKNLKEYIVEGIFDTDEDTIDKNIKNQIEQFLKDNFRGASSCKISDKPNADGKYEVSSNKDIIIKHEKIESLTNGMFIWTSVGGNFDCSGASLTSLEGAPKEVGACFECYGCKLLTSLKGAPKKVDGIFDCCGCDLLTSLEGAPKEVGGRFDCSYCKSLKSLEGAPEKISKNFDCNSCTSLTSLEDAPKEVGGSFICYSCGATFTIKDVKKVSKVGGEIYL